MASPTEILEQIKGQLGELPARLAAAIGAHRTQQAPPGQSPEVPAEPEPPGEAVPVFPGQPAAPRALRRRRVKKTPDQLLREGQRERMRAARLIARGGYKIGQAGFPIFGQLASLITRGANLYTGVQDVREGIRRYRATKSGHWGKRPPRLPWQPFSRKLPGGRASKPTGTKGGLVPKWHTPAKPASRPATSRVPKTQAPVRAGKTQHQPTQATPRPLPPRGAGGRFRQKTTILAAPPAAPPKQPAAKTMIQPPGFKTMLNPKATRIAKPTAPKPTARAPESLPVMPEGKDQFGALDALVRELSELRRTFQAARQALPRPGMGPGPSGAGGAARPGQAPGSPGLRLKGSLEDMLAAARKSHSAFGSFSGGVEEPGMGGKMAAMGTLARLLLAVL